MLSEAGPRRARLRTTALGLLALALVASNVSSGAALALSDRLDTETETWRALTGEGPRSVKIHESFEIGRALARIVPEGSTVLVDEYQLGYAVVLAARRSKMFVDHTHPQYDQALRRPQEFVDYVLVPDPEGRGALYAVNRIHPTLYTKGAPWAEVVDRLPPTTTISWRLYRVKK